MAGPTRNGEPSAVAEGPDQSVPTTPTQRIEARPNHATTQPGERAEERRIKRAGGGPVVSTLAAQLPQTISSGALKWRCSVSSTALRRRAPSSRS